MQCTHVIDPTPFWQRRRYFVVMMAFFGLFNVYALRVNLSVAIVAMTENRTIEHPNGTVTYEQDFPWSSKEKGFILSSFFYGYLMTQVNNYFSVDHASIISVAYLSLLDCWWNCCGQNRW
jgi:hypothetical protein